jgi:hypothetical protein
VSENSVVARARQAALEPYTDAPASTEEWLKAVELGADAAMRVLLTELRDTTYKSYYSGDELGADGLGIDKVPDVVRVFKSLLEELGDA